MAQICQCGDLPGVLEQKVFCPCCEVAWHGDQMAPFGDHNSSTFEVVHQPGSIFIILKRRLAPPYSLSSGQPIDISADLELQLFQELRLDLGRRRRCALKLDGTNLVLHNGALNSKICLCQHDNLVAECCSNLLQCLFLGLSGRN